MPKAIRFSELIKQAGRPYAATLWTDPARDPAFQKAVKENRVVTVKQETVGNKTDFGTIGFSREKNVSYFIFPRKLPNAPQARVVGIKYELLDGAKRISAGGANVSVSRTAMPRGNRGGSSVASPYPKPKASPQRKRKPTPPQKSKTPGRPRPTVSKREDVAKPVPSAPREKEFIATIKRVALWEKTLHIKAANKKEAEAHLSKAIAAEKFADSEAVVRNEIRSLDEA